MLFYASLRDRTREATRDHATHNDDCALLAARWVVVVVVAMAVAVVVVVVACVCVCACVYVCVVCFALLFDWAR